MDERRFLLLQEKINKEFGRKDRWHEMYHRFRRWLDGTKSNWQNDDPLLKKAS